MKKTKRIFAFALALLLAALMLPCSGLHDPLVIQMIGVVPVIGAMSHHLGDIQLNGSGKEGPQYGAENGIGHQADSHHGPGPIPPVR